MNIEPIIYETTRGMYSVEDKMSIASLILFCWKLGGTTFCELLYTDNHEKFIADLNTKYDDYKIDLSINLTNKQIKTCFENTLEKVKEKYDSGGFYKALYEGDEYAIVIGEIVKSNFNKRAFNMLTKNINTKLNASKRSGVAI